MHKLSVNAKARTTHLKNESEYNKSYEACWAYQESTNSHQEPCSMLCIPKRDVEARERAVHIREVACALEDLEP
jgi:hypothetical protein